MCDSNNLHNEVVDNGPEGDPPGQWLVEFVNPCTETEPHEIHRCRGWAWL